MNEPGSDKDKEKIKGKSLRQMAQDPCTAHSLFFFFFVHIAIHTSRLDQGPF